MEPITSIKQHDFISGKPQYKWFIRTNPCREMLLKLDYASLYPQTLHLKDCVPTTEIHPQGEQEEIRRSVDEMVKTMNEMTNQERFEHKLTLNSFY
jgi:hypothetical protein